ncbi:MAG: sensor histidine kinase N-terminal domain-containing protein [Sulfuricellaceae bacterium]
MTEDTHSLRTHLMNWLFTPLFVLWIFSTASGYISTLNFANKPYDLALLERAQAAAEQLGLGSRAEHLHARITLAENTISGIKDRIYYTVSTQDGKFLAGNARLPRPPAFLAKKSGPLFSDAEHKAEKIRMVTLHYPHADGSAIMLQMAETVGKRQDLARGILGNIVIPQILLIVMAAAAVWYALKRGLAPLEHLRQGVERRTRDDLSLIAERKAPEEVRPLIRAVNDLLQRLKQVVNSQRRFVADAAHQLRTPFAGLKTQAELALRETSPERIQHALQQILAGAERCNHLVNQLLALARNEPGVRIGGAPEPLELNRLAQETTMQWVPAALEKGLDLGFEGFPKAVPVRGDPLGLAEMMGNLLDNAIRYTPAGGAVTLSVGYEMGGGVLRVEDNGPGIAPEHRERVFERFYRILGSGQKGSGLGLAIVCEVVKSHNASVELSEGAGGRGTRVTVRFPHHHAV